MKGELSVHDNKLYVVNEYGDEVRVSNVFKGYQGFYKVISEFSIDPEMLVVGNKYEYECINDFQYELK